MQLIVSLSNTSQGSDRSAMLRSLSASIPVEHATDTLKTLTHFLITAYDARPRTKVFRTSKLEMQKLTLEKEDSAHLIEALKEDSASWEHHKVSVVTDTFTHRTRNGLSIIVQPQEVTVSVPVKQMASLSARAPSPTTRKTAWVMVYVVDTDKFLMLKRAPKTNNPNLWNFPGGGVEEGDSVVKGAKRELFEEAGIKVRKSDLQWIAESLDGLTTYFLLVLEKEPRLNIDPRESSKHAWMTLDEIQAKGNKLHRKTAEFVNTKIYRNLTRLAIRRSGIG